MKNYNVITATNLALEIVEEKYGQNPYMKYVIVGSGAYEYWHIPETYRDKTTIWNEDLRRAHHAYNLYETVFILVRVLEHINPIELPENIKIVGITPDMDYTAKQIESRSILDYKLQRDMYEIFNPCTHDYLECHKWWTNKTNIKHAFNKVSFYDSILLDGYRHIVSICEDINKRFFDDKIILSSIRDETFSPEYIAGNIEDSVKIYKLTSIKLTNIFEFLNIQDSLYFMFLLYNICLKYEIEDVYIDVLDMSKLDKTKYHIHSQAITTYTYPMLIDNICTLEGYFKITYRGHEDNYYRVKLKTIM